MEACNTNALSAQHLMQTLQKGLALSLKVPPPPRPVHTTIGMDIQSHHFMANRLGKMETVTDFIFLGPKITADGDHSHEIKTLAPWKESYDKSQQHI